MNNYETFIYKSRYARFSPVLSRRETWEETVNRYIQQVIGDKCSASQRKELKSAILNMEIMPSMRALMTAGPALERDNVAGYNCAYLPIDDRRAFDEIMYILMCGTGVGYSVEWRYIDKLPTIPCDFFDDGTTTIHVADSRIGWSIAFRKLISLLYDGLVPTIDYKNIREKGRRLATFGGRASGPDPLRDLFDFTINQFKQAKGRK